MIEALRAPLRSVNLVIVALCAVAAVTLYCVAYNALSGRSESVLAGTVWTIVNVLPWLAAFEASKRIRLYFQKMFVLCVAFAVSLGLSIISGQEGGLGFEVIRRFPGLLITTALLLLVNSSAPKHPTNAVAETALPMALQQIDWVAAAGNYVELHGDGRTTILRARLSSLEAQLASHGFIRIHRSTIVRRDFIKRVRSVDIILRDGTSLKTGKRYRSRVPRGNFVPSSH